MSGNDSEIFLISKDGEGQTLSFSAAEMALRDEDGAIVPLRRQAAKMLAALAEEPGKIVAKQELVEKVWGKSAVTDDSLTQCISEIRRVIGDHDRTILQTHPRLGYSLSVGTAASSRTEQRFRSRTAIAAVVVAATILVGAFWIWKSQIQESRLPSVAVLAFDDLSVAPDAGYLSDAISEGIIAELARFLPFTTVARNSSFALRDRPHDIREIGRILNADYVLEGSQQKHGDQLKITVQLINSHSGTHLWAETYSGTLDDLFDFQSEIIREVASTVGGKLAVYPGLTGDSDTFEAMHLAARGLIHLRTPGMEAKEKARAYFEAAVEADPEHVTGYRGLGFYFRNVANHAVNETERKEAIGEASLMANKSLAIAPDDYLTHYLLGHIHVLKGEISLARARYDKAQELNPSFSNVFVGGSTTKIYVGDTEEAIADIRHAMSIDPLHPEWFHGQLAWAQWAAFDCEAANSAMENMTKVPAVTQKTWAAIHACRGELADARNAMSLYLQARPNATLSDERERVGGVWVAEGQVDRWLDDLRLAGMPE